MISIAEVLFTVIFMLKTQYFKRALAGVRLPVSLGLDIAPDSRTKSKRKRQMGRINGSWGFTGFMEVHPACVQDRSSKVNLASERSTSRMTMLLALLDRSNPTLVATYAQTSTC